MQQPIKSGRTFEGRAYLIELKSDIELSRGGERDESDLRWLFPFDQLSN